MKFRQFFVFSVAGRVRRSSNRNFHRKIRFSAWTTAAVDNERVIGAFPIVMDMLKLQQVRI